jgi:energy-coupling factor transporter ATP-binding protein EcfA2
MKLTLQKQSTSITIEMDEMDMSDIIDSFVYMLFGLGYSMEEIEDHILKASELIKNNHKDEQPNKNLSII